MHRKPSIKRIGKLLGWQPKVGFEAAVSGTLDYFLRDAASKNQGGREH